MGATEDIAAWEGAGRRVVAGGHELFVVDREPLMEADGPPILILHGFPTCSYDWRHVIDDLSVRRRVVVPDMLGYGLSPKPDQRYSLFEHADLMTDVVVALGVDEVDLVTHDMGDSVGGELLARSVDDTLPFAVRRRVLTNGSIYIDMAQLTIGQQLLLGLPDERMPDNPNDGTAFKGGLTGTFPPDAPPSDDELEAQWQLVHREPRRSAHAAARALHRGAACARGPLDRRDRDASRAPLESYGASSTRSRCGRWPSAWLRRVQTLTSCGSRASPTGPASKRLAGSRR